MENPTVLQRGLYPSSQDECVYIITFEQIPYTGIFQMDLIAPTTWHYDGDIPTNSYFQRKIGNTLAKFPITECTILGGNRDISTVVNDTYITGCLIGLARLPNDIECFEYLSRQDSPNDDALLDRKRENQTKSKNKALQN